jgi:hypothetical protein
MNEIFIVTDPEAGWDCIQGAFTSIESLVKTLELPSELKTLEEVDAYFNKRNNYMRVIHKVKLQ